VLREFEKRTDTDLLPYRFFLLFLYQLFKADGQYLGKTNKLNVGNKAFTAFYALNSVFIIFHVKFNKIQYCARG